MYTGCLYYVIVFLFESADYYRTFRDKSDPSELLALCHKLSLDLSEDLKRSDLEVGENYFMEP